MSVQAGSHYVDNQSPDQRPFDGVRWIDVFNVDTQDLPAGCLLAVNRYAVESDSSGAEPGTALVTAPTTNNQTALLVNGPTPISQGEYGQAHNDFPSSVLFEAGDGIPKIGDQWGSQVGCPKLRLGQAGYIFQGISTTDQYGVVVPALQTAVLQPAGCVATFVSNVCGSVVEYTTMNLLTCQVLNIFCVTSPTGCCGTIISGCCTPQPPSVLCLSLAISTANPGRNSGFLNNLSCILTYSNGATPGSMPGWQGETPLIDYPNPDPANPWLNLKFSLFCLPVDNFGNSAYALFILGGPSTALCSYSESAQPSTQVCTPVFTLTYAGFSVSDTCITEPGGVPDDNDIYTITISSDLSNCNIPPPVTVACCPLTLSSALTLSLSGVSHFAASYPMTWDSVNSRYSTGTITVGGFANCEFRFACIGSTSNSWQLTQYCGGSLLVTKNSSTGACSPFSVGFIGPLSLAYGVVCGSVDSATGAIVTGASGGGSGGGGTGPVVTSCCPLGLPTTIHVTLTNVSGSCGCLAGSYALTWLPNQNVWVYSGTLCSVPIIIQFGCVSGSPNQWYILAFASSVVFYDQSLSSVGTCSPFNVAFANEAITSPCTGTINATVTA